MNSGLQRFNRPYMQVCGLLFHHACNFPLLVNLDWNASRRTALSGKQERSLTRKLEAWKTPSTSIGEGGKGADQRSRQGTYYE
jgi:hypothetical protein